MTLENFKYRTDPMFLRNQFDGDNDFGIPIIPKTELSEDDIKDLRLFPFNAITTDNGKHLSRIIHFFLYDYNFEKIWINPDKYVDLLSKYKGVLTPDFSMYLEMPYALQIYNTFRNRWCGAYLADKGIRVIPTVSWADEKSFDFCFKGIEKGSIVAVSTYMFHEHDHHADQKDLFMKGYNKMLETVEPSKIICYSEPFDEMAGDIIYIDYDLSSWQHYNDDVGKTFVIKKTIMNTSNKKIDALITKTGYITKGGGSAYGGDWIPKKESDKRFLGESNSQRANYVETKKGGYNTRDKYDEDGKAIIERHYTDHGRPDKHSDPHDHEINWDNGYPELGPPINYHDGNIPELKGFIRKGEKTMKAQYDPEENKFETLGEFKLYLSRGANVGFEYNGTEYGIEGHNDKYDIWIYDGGDIANDLSLEEVLNFEIGKEKIREIILQAEITERIL